MDNLPSSSNCLSDGRGRSKALHVARAGLVSFLALGVPVDESIRFEYAGSTVTAQIPDPPDGGEFQPLPAGWPNETPELATSHEFEIWNLVWKHCARYGVAEQALVMYRVLWEESRLLPDVRSACGRYVGISQFVRSTFTRNVQAMKRLGLVPKTEVYSPFDPDNAIEVMAWMWSQGYERHWGPYRRAARKVATGSWTIDRLN